MRRAHYGLMDGARRGETPDNPALEFGAYVDATFAYVDALAMWTAAGRTGPAPTEFEAFDTARTEWNALEVGTR